MTRIATKIPRRLEKTPVRYVVSAPAGHGWAGREIRPVAGYGKNQSNIATVLGTFVKKEGAYCHCSDERITLIALKTRRKPRHEEQNRQIAIARYLDLVRLPSWFWFHVPNGGKRTKAEAGILKAMGVKAGVADIFIVYNERCFVIEMKADDGSLSDSQKKTLPQLVAAGAKTAICRTLDDVIAQLRAWKIPTRDAVHGQ